MSLASDMEPRPEVTPVQNHPQMGERRGTEGLSTGSFGATMSWNWLEAPREAAGTPADSAGPEDIAVALSKATGRSRKLRPGT